MAALKYNVHGDPAKQDAAAAALHVYKSVVDKPSRKRFLEEFDLNGGGKGKGTYSLKFATTFRKRLRCTDETSIGDEASFLTGTVNDKCAHRHSAPIYRRNTILIL